MGRRRGVTVGAPAVLVAALLVGLVGSAAAAESGEVTVWRPGGLTVEILEAVEGAAHRTGARFGVIQRGTIRLQEVAREGRTVQAAPPGFSYPLAAAAVAPRPARSLYGREVAEVLQRGEVVFGRRSAALRGAEAGDTIRFAGWDGSDQTRTVGLVVDDPEVGWTELLFSAPDAASFGFVRPSEAVLWGARSLDHLAVTLWVSLPDDVIRLRSSHDPTDPNSVLPSVLVKERFGEFAYRPTGDGDRIEIESAWRKANIVDVDLPPLGRFRCHRALVPYLRAALLQAADVGLTDLIDPQDFQIAGGCFNPRLIRGGDKGGAISRHAWGIAVDINPSDNPYGGVVGMDRRLAAIFQRWGFSWGGGWTYPDGGHFEWNRIPEMLFDT